MSTRTKLQMPYKNLLPTLTTEERDALRRDIKANGVRDAVVIDEDGNILDGHNRYDIDKQAPTRTISGLTESEKIAFVFRANFTRRNLSPDQKAEIRKRQKELAKDLREEDPKKWTQEQIAVTLGVSRECVSKWFNRDR